MLLLNSNSVVLRGPQPWGCLQSVQHKLSAAVVPVVPFGSRPAVAEAGLAFSGRKLVSLLAHISVAHSSQFLEPKARDPLEGVDNLATSRGSRAEFGPPSGRS